MAIALRFRGRGNCAESHGYAGRNVRGDSPAAIRRIRRRFGTLRDGVARVTGDPALQIEIAFQALQIGAQIGRRLMPEIAVFFEQFGDDVVHPLGNLGIELGRRDGIFVRIS